MRSGFRLALTNPDSALRTPQFRILILVAREGLEPSKPLGRQIYSLLRLTAPQPRQLSLFGVAASCLPCGSDCLSQKLGLSLHFRPAGLLRWSWRRDLNPRPADYKSAALPVELRQRGDGRLATIDAGSPTGNGGSSRLHEVPDGNGGRVARPTPRIPSCAPGPPAVDLASRVRSRRPSSNRITAAAVETFKDSIRPDMGIRTR